VVIDSDKLSYIHRTPSEASAQERAYGGSDAGNNQVGDFPEASGATLTAGADPGQLGTIAHRRQYENFLAALDGTEPIRVDLQTNRQAIAIITGVYESSRTGRPVSLA
jgi:predicted dehydrogenase